MRFGEFKTEFVILNDQSFFVRYLKLIKTILLFYSDPERSRSERSAQLDFEISRYKEEESKLKSKLKIMEAEIEVNLKVHIFSQTSADVIIFRIIIK